MKNHHNSSKKYVLFFELATLLISTTCSRAGGNPDRITLTFAPYEDQVKTIQPIVNSCEKENAGVEIQVVPVKPGQIHDPTDLPSLADVIYLEGISLAGTNGFLDLRPFLDRQADFDAEELCLPKGLWITTLAEFSRKCRLAPRWKWWLQPRSRG